MMANEGLEVIVAHWLFAMPAEKIAVIIHPQSLVHSMVEYIDGSIISQIGAPDMRTPIAYGLGFPQRIESGLNSLDLSEMQSLSFEKPCYKRFPALRLAFEALATSQAACVTLNAANEVAVERFLQKKIRYTDIPIIIEQSINHIVGKASFPLNNLEQILMLDTESRAIADEFCLDRK